MISFDIGGSVCRKSWSLFRGTAHRSSSEVHLTNDETWGMYCILGVFQGYFRGYRALCCQPWVVEDLCHRCTLILQYPGNITVPSVRSLQIPEMKKVI